MPNKSIKYSELVVSKLACGSSLIIVLILFFTLNRYKWIVYAGLASILAMILSADIYESCRKKTLERKKRNKMVDYEFDLMRYCLVKPISFLCLRLSEIGLGVYLALFSYNSDKLSNGLKGLIAMLSLATIVLGLTGLKKDYNHFTKVYRRQLALKNEWLNFINKLQSGLVPRRAIKVMNKLPSACLDDAGKNGEFKQGVIYFKGEDHGYIFKPKYEILFNLAVELIKSKYHLKCDTIFH